MTGSRRRTALLLAPLVALCYCLWWVYAARTVRTGLDDWAARQRAAGAEVAFSGVEVGGFPLAVRLSTRNVAIRQRDGLGWTAPDLVAWARPWRITRIHVAIQGPQVLTLPGDGRHPPVTVTAKAGATAKLGLALATGAVTSAEIVVDGLGLDITGVDGTVTARRFQATLSQPAAAQAGAPAPAAAATLLDVGLPAGLPSPLGTSLERADLALHLVAGAPSRFDPVAIRAWTAAGGSAAIDTIGLVWGPVNARGEGSLTLDEAGRPAGNLTLEVTGAEAAIDALVRSGVIRPRDAGMIQMAVGFLSMQPRDAKTPPTLKLPLRLQDGWLGTGPAARILRLPPLLP